MSDLEPQQERFCQEYLVDLNQTQAYIRAGYAKKGAAQNAARLMANDKVQARIRELMAARTERTEITQDRVITEIAKVAFASMRSFIEIDEDGQPKINLDKAPLDDLDALSEVSTETVLESNGPDREPDHIRKTRIKIHNKLDALEKLAQHTGVYKERDKDRANALSEAFEQLMSRGSRIPLARNQAEGDA